MGMKFSKQSEKLIKKLNIKSSISASGNKDINMLYELINKASEETKEISIDTKYSTINSVKDIPKPISFNSNFLPDIIRDSINNDSTSYIHYIYVLDKRQITIYMVFNEENIELEIDKYTEYIRTI